MNGVANGDVSGHALQGLTVQGSNNSANTENKITESPSERFPRNKVSIFFLCCFKFLPV